MDLDNLDQFVLVFKTNANPGLKAKVTKALALFNEINKIDFDFEDCDNILRVEVKRNIGTEIESVINSKGIYCKELH